MNIELDDFADADDLPHLAHHEILEMRGVQQTPPIGTVLQEEGASPIEAVAVSPLPAFVTKTLLSDRFDTKTPGTLRNILLRPIQT